MHVSRVASRDAGLPLLTPWNGCFTLSLAEVCFSESLDKQSQTDDTRRPLSSHGPGPMGLTLVLPLPASPLPKASPQALVSQESLGPRPRSPLAEQPSRPPSAVWTGACGWGPWPPCGGTPASGWPPSRHGTVPGSNKQHQHSPLALLPAASETGFLPRGGSSRPLSIGRA